ncbi:hypothetical protein AA0243_1313 [Novacetimonas hansenii NRIC 0243]|nr:hypothetical protein AA0243_1313 [Novacetimonas hansenii NRIC 0243]
MLPGLQEQDGDRRINFGGEGQQDGGFRTKGGHQPDTSTQRTRQGNPHDIMCGIPLGLQGSYN